MATLVSTLVDNDYKNWVKGGLALKYARKGIQNFVERNIDSFHHNIVTGLSTNCYNCSTENIIPCKYNNNFCKLSKNNCKVHNPKDHNKKSRKCPNSVCNVIRDEIVNQHRFNGPSWSNTDSRRWCREPWQLATCYMSDGYKSSNSASETDLPGLLSVIINNKIFDTEITENLRKKNNIFCKARDARNDILHKADMRLSDIELAGYIATLDNMLADPKCLSGHPDSIQSKGLLQQILNGTLNVTTRHESAVREDALRAIEEKKDEALTTIDIKEQLSVAALQKALHEAQRQLKVKERDSVAILQTISTDTFNKKKKEALTTIATTERISLGTLQNALDEAQKQLKVKETEAKAEIKTVLVESDDKNRKALKEELISIYQDGEQLSTPLGPIATDEDKHIDELYVAPNMKRVDHQKANDTGRPVKGYQDVFKGGKKKIYVVGDAGTGKTSLCQKMVSTWCKINIINNIDNMSDNQLAMAKFDFLFYISLRHVVNENTIDEMIKHQLFPNKQSLHEPLSKALNEDGCLIMLDGLDEWKTENKTAASTVYNRGLPGRDAVRKCTILTTTRPWKLERLQLKATQIDTMINLLGLDETSIELLARNMINHLNDKFHCKKMYTNFNSDLNDKELDNLMTIPVILKQIICLWHSGKNPGSTKCAIYIQMLELLLELALPRLQEDQLYQQKREGWVKSSLKLPSCFDGYEKCQDFKPLLATLAKLAFQTILSENTEESLVFKRTQEGCYGLTSEEVNICLKIGILSQNKIMLDCTAQFKKLSFLHKTYQEFLAALFVSPTLSDTKQCVQTLQQVCNTEEKGYEMANVLTFISGLCRSDITCKLLDHICPRLSSTQSIITNCMREGWKGSHDNKHLFCEDISIEEPSQYLEQLCQVNITNIKVLYIYSGKVTAQCLKYLLQIHTLKQLCILPQSNTFISEYMMYYMIEKNRNTLSSISIQRMTLISKSKLAALIHQLPHLRSLSLEDITLPQQLLARLHALNLNRLYRRIYIQNPTILPDRRRIN